MLAVALIGAAVTPVVAAERPRYCGTARWESLIAEAAQRFAVPVAWVREVMRAESAGCATLDGRPVVSTAGAMGLMQLMPGTWAELRERHVLGADPHDPRDNVLAGAAYLRELHERFGDEGFLAAYHAGPARYEAHRQRGEPLPRATERYLVRVRAALDVPRSAGSSIGTAARDALQAEARLFAVDRRARGTPASALTTAPNTSLFVPIRGRDAALQGDVHQSPEPLVQTADRSPTPREAGCGRPEGGGQDRRRRHADVPIALSARGVWRHAPRGVRAVPGRKSLIGMAPSRARCDQARCGAMVRAP